MNYPFLIFLIFALVIISVAIICYYFSKKVVVKRMLKKAVGKKISDFQNGDIAKVIGKVEFVGDPLIAPLSGRQCAYYHILVEEEVSSGDDSDWNTLIEEEKAGTFVIRDGRYCAHINCSNIKSYLVQDRVFASGYKNDATEVLEKYLQSHGKKSEGLFGFNKTLRYKEGVLEEGELIAVIGKGEWKNASQLQLPGSYGRVLDICSTEQEPVYLSDDPDTVKIKNAEQDFSGL